MAIKKLGPEPLQKKRKLLCSTAIPLKKTKVKLNSEQAKLKAKETRLFSTYGLTLNDWTRMFEGQDKVCWICQKLPKSGVLCVDHLHQKGFKKMSPEEKKKYIRGLVCFGCNTVFSRFERRLNSRWLFERVRQYFLVFSMKGDET